MEKTFKKAHSRGGVMTTLGQPDGGTPSTVKGNNNVSNQGPEERGLTDPILNISVE